MQSIRIEKIMMLINIIDTLQMKWLCYSFEVWETIPDPWSMSDHETVTLSWIVESFHIVIFSYITCPFQILVPFCTVINRQITISFQMQKSHYDSLWEAISHHDTVADSCILTVHETFHDCEPFLEQFVTLLQTVDCFRLRDYFTQWNPSKIPDRITVMKLYLSFGHV